MDTLSWRGRVDLYPKHIRLHELVRMDYRAPSDQERGVLHLYSKTDSVICSIDGQGAAAFEAIARAITRARPDLGARRTGLRHTVAQIAKLAFKG